MTTKQMEQRLLDLSAAYSAVMEFVRPVAKAFERQAEIREDYRVLHAEWMKAKS